MVIGYTFRVGYIFRADCIYVYVEKGWLYRSMARYFYRGSKMGLQKFIYNS
jgi:hypothetical protein